MKNISLKIILPSIFACSLVLTSTQNAGAFNIDLDVLPGGTAGQTIVDASGSATNASAADDYSPSHSISLSQEIYQSGRGYEYSDGTTDKQLLGAAEYMDSVDTDIFTTRSEASTSIAAGSRIGLRSSLRHQSSVVRAFASSRSSSSSSDTPIPEPTTILLIGMGLIGLLGVRSRINKQFPRA
ncbi:MAG: hypothetical protein COA36_17440 [Desulfotalea sp.]|nr:MAG: hypothetical protein COA36_17440 [Desulfotalea sp.]